MAEYLTEAAWKGELKKHPTVKDTGISEPLRKYNQLEKKDDQPSKVQRAQLLNQVVLKAKVAKKTHSKNEKLLDFLDGMLKEAKEALSKLQTELEHQEDKKFAKEDKKQDKEGINHETDKLRSRLKQALTTRMYFLLGVGSFNHLVLKKSKPGGKDVGEIKALSVDKIYRGVCMGEDGTLVFYFPKNPPMSMKGKIKQTIQEQAGLMMKVDCRNLEGLNQIEGLQKGAGDSDTLLSSFENADTAWQKVDSALRSRLGNLQRALVETDDQRAQKVAQGLNRLLDEIGPVGVAISGLCSYDRNADRSGLLPLQLKLKNAVVECNNSVASNRLVALVDNNPFTKVEFRKVIKIGLRYVTEYGLKVKIKV